MYDINEVEKYIRVGAAKRGIDPDIAVKVARSEGLASGVFQSNMRKNGVREPSYGPFQLLVGGGNTGFPTGMGNDFVARTGLNPADPSTVNAQVDFALDGAAKNGWGAWYGAKAAGIGNRDGINGAKPVGLTLNSAPPTASPDTAMAATAASNMGTPAAPSVAEGMGRTLLGDATSAKFKQLGADMKDPNTTAGGIASLLGKATGSGQQQASYDTQITPSAISNDDLGSRMAGAQQLMSTLLAARNKRKVMV